MPTLDPRRRMVEEQLRSRGIRDLRVLEAMATVRREEFVSAKYRDSAYDDHPLPIGYGQTISQPFTVAFMCQALELGGDEKVLEVGTGSGYGAAVLSKLARWVYTIECVPQLARRARTRLKRLSFRNITVRSGDGSLGLPDEAPFDAIVVTAGAPVLPESYLEQLAEGGRLIIPLGKPFFGQSLYRFKRTRGQVATEDLGGFAFVPLRGKLGVPFGTT